MGHEVIVPHLLANPIYRGTLTHKGEVFEGEHEAIVSDELWNEVQFVRGGLSPHEGRTSL